MVDLLGKVEGTTFLNTRMRTLDGLTVFIPNRQIFNDIVINYVVDDSGEPVRYYKTNEYKTATRFSKTLPLRVQESNLPYPM